MKNELELDRIRSKHEHETSMLKKRFTEDSEAAREELKVRDERVRRLNEKLRDLEDTLSSERNENKRLKETLEREKKEFYATLESERNSIKRSYTAQLNVSRKHLI